MKYKQGDILTYNNRYRKILGVCGEVYFMSYESEDTKGERLMRTEKLKLLDEVIHQSTVNLKSAKAVAGWAELRKEQLEAEL